MNPKVETLVAVVVESGVTPSTNEGFCLVTAMGSDGATLVGQLTVEEVRKMALDWLCSAEAAEQDAVIMAHFAGDAEGAAALLGRLRRARDRVTPPPDQSSN